MVSLIFASKARLAQTLAVADERIASLTRERDELRERLARSEREFGRLRDQLLLRQGHIGAPLADHAPPAAHPLAAVMHAMTLTGTSTASDAATSIEAPMPGA